MNGEAQDKTHPTPAYKQVHPYHVPLEPASSTTNKGEEHKNNQPNKCAYNKSLATSLQGHLWTCF
jgi:hypothetical protein